MRMQPIGELLQAAELTTVGFLIALGIQAHEHLGEIRIELLDVLAEIGSVLEIELVLP